MDEGILQLSVIAASSIGAAQLLRSGWRRLARRSLALRINQPLPEPPLPGVQGDWREACCGALIGAALGEAVGLLVRPLPRTLALRLGRDLDPLRRAPWRPFWKAGRYAITTQLLLAASRAVESDGHLNLRRYRLELAFLHRYAVHPSAAVSSVASALRRGPLTAMPLAARVSLSCEAAVVGVPLGLVWHHAPEEAAQRARELASQTHARAEVHQAAALMASATAHAVTAVDLRRRRQLLEQIILDGGGPEGATAIAIKPAADLAARPLDENLSRLSSGTRVLDLLPIALTLALRYDDDIAGLLQVLPRLGRQAPVVGALAGALVGARAGLPALRGLPVFDRLQDREALEIHGEKLSVAEPA